MAPSSPAVTEPLLSVEKASVRAGGRTLVEGVSLTARAGELTAVIGPNGAGKTSLLEAIVGVRPSDGIVRLSGEPLVRFVTRARAFAYLPDQAELPAETSVRTLVEHAQAHAKGSVDALALRRALGVDPLLEQGAGVLSRGERQRVALFSALVLGRPVVILDEPFNAFDPLQLRDALGAVRSVLATGTAVVASIHQLGDAEKVADHILLMAEGRALAFGTFAELRTEAGTDDMSLEQIFVELLSRRVRAA
jgi:ABC-2 type transport system ATP-binding protein